MESTTVAKRILALRERHRALIAKEGRAAANLYRIHDRVFQRPYTTIEEIVKAQHLTPAGAGKLVNRLIRLGILEEMTGRKRSRLFAYTSYVAHFGEPPG